MRQRIYFFFDRILFPILLFRVYHAFRFVDFGHLDWVQIVAALISPAIIFFLLTARKAKTAELTIPAMIGIFLHGLILLMPFDFSIQASPVIVSCAWKVFGGYCLLTLLAYSTLGRNVAIVPSVKNVVTQGLYRLVRHPVYGCLIHVYLCIAIAWPTPRNFFIAACAIAGAQLRAVAEEAILLQIPAYSAYQSQVRRRFFHCLLSAPLACLGFYDFLMLCAK